MFENGRIVETTTGHTVIGQMRAEEDGMLLLLDCEIYIDTEGKVSGYKMYLSEPFKGEEEGITAEGDIYIANDLKISYVGQDTSSLKGSLYDIAKERGCDKTIFSTILIKMGFTKEMLYRDVSALSLGQKKFVMIALSLCEHADLYLWDEPLNYIDVYLRQEIERLVKCNNVTMLFVEHDRTFSEAVCDKEVQM